MTDPSHDPLVQQVLRELSPRNAAIVAYQFGINDGEMHTLAETAAEFARVRRREAQPLPASDEVTGAIVIAADDRDPVLARVVSLIEGPGGSRGHTS